MLLQRNEQVRDEIGGVSAQWVDVATLNAEIRSVSGRAYLSASAEQAEVTAEVLMRYRPDVKSGMRLVRGAEIYTIVAPLPDAKRTELRCMCSEGVLT
ncbi:phage head closure protein [Vreelandella alkaliphila]|uniref:Phage head closure protein n=1 Tax=Vreelandella alkaliphila TaxID=272774 RepID=A0A7C9P3B3_9GAMM|nr:phage head closure protein [Halomonas alkaliphila]